jgi:hypothetical protein
MLLKDETLLLETALVLAHAVQHDLLRNTDLQILAELSRQPFLWRSLRRLMEGSRSLEIDGRYVGYLLNSFWNDPIPRNPRVIVRSAEEGWISVHLPMEGGKDLLFKALLPMHFYGQVRDVDADVPGTITFEGHIAEGSGSALYVHGCTTIICENIEVAANAITIDGQLWLESATIVSSPRIKLGVRKGAKVGWGGKVAESYPWSEVPSSLVPPPKGPPDVVTALITECSLRPPSGVLVVSDDYSFSVVENQWVEKRFPGKFPQLLKLLIKHGLADGESFGTYAQTKFRIHMRTTWMELRNALTNPSEAPTIQSFLTEARRVLN